MKPASSVCIGRYTFRVKALGWFIFIVSIGVVAYAVTRWRKRWEEHQRIAQARFAEFMAQARPPAAAPPAAAPVLAAQERLLLEAAGKAGEAGEPALAIQLYARLLSRFPQSAFAAQARAAVAEQKKKLAST
jgi:hypothetical protein